MGTYYNPPEDIPKIGRPLRPGTYPELAAQLHEGEVLIGFYDAPHPYRAAPLIDCQEEFNRQQRQAPAAGFYALPRDQTERGFKR
jgi:hypothetical protein